MSQHDYTIDNANGPNSRADFNLALKALASNNSGATAPATTYAYMLWYDTATNLFKMRNADDDAWITLALFNQTSDYFLPYLEGVSIKTLLAAKVATTGNETVAGVKTFSSNPVISALTASRVVLTSAGKALASSAVTSTELGYVSGVTSAIQTQLNALVAEMALIPQRAKFSYNSTTVIDISLARYRHVGTTAQTVYWNSSLSYTVAGLAVSDWSYIYLSDTAIVASGSPIITTTQLTASTTEPTWSAAKNGWYNGDDRCIFAVLTNGSSEIIEFFNDGGDLVMYADGITDQAAIDIDTTWTDFTLTLPSFCAKALVTFEISPAGNTDGRNSYWRTNDQTGTTGHLIKRVDASFWTGTDFTEKTVITDSSQVIEVKMGGDGDDKIGVVTDGWHFPVGM